MKTLLIMAAVTATFLNAQAENWSVTSPNGQVKVSIQLGDLGGTADYPKGNRLYYKVEQGTDGARAMVIPDSPLGLKLEGRDFLDGMAFTAAEPVKAIDEKYEVLHGKRRQCENHAQQLTLSFKNSAGDVVAADFRAYNDGVAFRYRLSGKDAKPQVLEAEATGFRFNQDAKLWMAPSDKPTTYAPAYETYYECGIAAGAASPLGFGWSFPVLFRTGDRWGLITEANVGTNFCGSRLSNSASNGVYRVSLPSADEGLGTGSPHPSSTLPWEMPWRVIIVGNSLATVAESTLVSDVCPPSRVKNTDWIKPGRVAWSWWSDNPSPQDGAKQKKFVDLAAEMGWEYMLIDANWDIMDNGNFHDVVRYAKEKGVGVLLWYNSGGPHNVVTEKPRDTLSAREVRRHELKLLKEWGVKGIKVDFFQSDKQNVISLYQGILQDAVDFQIMVNFHGCTLPRGWERTWPHLMSMEALRGEECYIFDDKYPDKAPVQNTILPFTRNAVGPMDYTPVTFSHTHRARRTTSAHELALSVLFETGWLHFADKAEAYLSLPDAPKAFLKQVPVTWDDTRYVAGEPGQFAVIARRHGDTWYVGGINALGQAREEKIRVGSWLGNGSFKADLITDGADARSFGNSAQTIAAGQEITVKMLPYGGFAGTLKAAK